jgi:hypothetical protein
LGWVPAGNKRDARDVRGGFSLPSACSQPLSNQGARYTGLARLELYDRGLKGYVLAPLVLALVVIPGFLQHVVEYD